MSSTTTTRNHRRHENPVGVLRGSTYNDEERRDERRDETKRLSKFALRELYSSSLHLVLVVEYQSRQLGIPVYLYRSKMLETPLYRYHQIAWSNSQVSDAHCNPCPRKFLRMPRFPAVPTLGFSIVVATSLVAIVGIITFSILASLIFLPTLICLVTLLVAMVTNTGKLLTISVVVPAISVVSPVPTITFVAGGSKQRKIIPF